MNLRLFIGITAPSEWKTALTAWRRHIQSRFSDSFGRWTSESNLHLTLRFFGSVEEEKALPIVKELQQIAGAADSFSVTPGPLGCFPNASRPRILWLGLKGQTDALIHIESRLRALTGEFGQPPEDRPFHPHLTLARLKEPTRTDRDYIAELIRKTTPVEVAPWHIRELELIRSQPGVEGSVYTTLATVSLGR